MNIRQLIAQKGWNGSTSAGSLEIINLLRGKKIKFTDDSYQSYGFGTKRTVVVPMTATYNYNSGSDYLNGFTNTAGIMFAVLLDRIELIEDPQTVKDFQNELTKLDQKEAEIRAKKKDIHSIIKYMQENEVGEFDGDVYNIFKILKEIKGSDMITRAKEIAKLIK